MVWKDAGWGTIIFLAALAAINQNLYEAAAVDGASRWRRLWHITLPGLRPVIVLLLILRLGDALNVGFEQFFLQRDAVGSGRRRGARHLRVLAHAARPASGATARRPAWSRAWSG